MYLRIIIIHLTLINPQNPLLFNPPLIDLNHFKLLISRSLINTNR
jgi:hypothetical protein